MTSLRSGASLLALLLLGACATVPTGPRTRVMPAPGKPFDVFVREDNTCRQYASNQVSADPERTRTSNAVGGAAIGTALGAGAGALAGGHEGAGVGAAAGLVFGALAGSSEGQSAGGELQRRYDLAYEQCMYANGNQVPGFRSQAYVPPPPPSGAEKPPPVRN